MNAAEDNRPCDIVWGDVSGGRKASAHREAAAQVQGVLQRDVQVQMRPEAQRPLLLLLLLTLERVRAAQNVARERAGAHACQIVPLPI
jgi:hypothetical protein